MDTLSEVEHLKVLLEKERAARLAAEASLLAQDTELQAARDKKRGESGTAQQEQLLGDVVRNLPGIVFQLKQIPDGRFIYNFISPAIHEMLGFMVEYTDQIIPFIHPEDRRQWVDHMAATYRQAKVWKQEIRFLMPDKTVYWWFGSASPSYSPNGELVYNGILLNISRQKQAEVSLLSSTTKLTTLIASIGDGILLEDEQHKIALCNHEFCSTFNIPLDPKQMTGKDVNQLLTANTSLFKDFAAQIALRNDLLDRCEVISDQEFQLVNGKFISWDYAPLIIDGVCHGHLWKFSDITLQKELEQELRTAKQDADLLLAAKDLFLANMSHEMRTPMNAIVGMTRLMEKTALNQGQQYFLKMIRQSITSLMVVVNDILDFSKIATGKFALENVGFHLEDIIVSTVKAIEYDAEEKGLIVEIKNDLKPETVLIGDPHRLNQIVMNLLTNAVKFTNKGSIKISCLNLGEEGGKQKIKIKVQDTGRGMEQDFLKILFEKFTQEDESIARSYTGTGLGLSITKHLVDLMGGSVKVDSEKNAGTTFEVDLSFEIGTNADIPDSETSLVDLSLLKSKRILLVEDNVLNQLVAQAVLEYSGMKVTLAVNGKEAVAVTDETDFDLILMDMQMPVMDGLQATSIIREKNKNIPIIALTANAITGERDKCLAVGMNDFLAKPFDENVLLGLIFKWLGGGSRTAGPELIASVQSPASGSAQPTPANADLYNLDQLSAIGRGNPDFIPMLVMTFIDDAEKTIAHINNAFVAGDLKTVKWHVHRIKPSFDQLAIPFSTEIRRIESLCLQEEGGEELGALIEKFNALIDQVTPVLRTEIARLKNQS